MKIWKLENWPLSTLWKLRSTDSVHSMMSFKITNVVQLRARSNISDNINAAVK